MVFFSVLMIIAGTTASVVTNQTKTLKRLKKKEEIYSLSREVKSALLSPAHCSDLLVGQTVSSNIALNSIAQNRRDSLVAAGQTYSESDTGLVIESISFKDLTSWSGPYSLGYLEVALRKNDSDAFAPIRIPKFVKVSGGVITACVDSAVREVSVTSGTATGIEAQCLNPDKEWISFITGICTCGGVQSAASKRITSPFLTSWSTGEYRSELSCYGCDFNSGDSLVYQIGCNLREGFL